MFETLARRCAHALSKMGSKVLPIAPVVAALLVASQPASAQQEISEKARDELVVTLLGTGTPAPVLDRFGYSNLIQAGGKTIMIDAGRGAMMRLYEMGIQGGDIDAVFFTHYHSDHTNGLSDLYTTGYLQVPNLGMRQSALRLYGPQGAKRLADGMRLAHKSDAEIRMADEGIPEAAVGIEGKDMEFGVVFDEGGLKVTMFPVLHGEKIEHTAGYKVEYKGRSVVFSGDTKYDENVLEQSRGVDLLVHEIGVSYPESLKREIVTKILAHHTSPEEAGELFAKAGPKLVALSHVVRLREGTKTPDMAYVVNRVRNHYDGPLVVGTDLMQFHIGDGGPTIVRAAD